MLTRSDAEENLRIIRSLMEKATIYRAISAPTALIGGLASIAVTIAFPSQFSSGFGSVEHARIVFLVSWLGVLIITATANTWLLWRDARRRGDIFLSAGMRAAVRAFSPSYLAAGVFTVLFARSPELLPPSWMLFYGIGLLATQHFAPRSITLLGWAFLIAGLLLKVCGCPALAGDTEPIRHANLAMGATFGLFHLIYAGLAWPREKAPPLAAEGV